jgi:DNA-binding NarL/FixJ family response regulator
VGRPEQSRRLAPGLQASTCNQCSSGPVVQEGLRALLSAVDDYELVEVVGTGAEAVRAAVTPRPDVVVMDLQMPGQNGIEATREIARLAPDVAVLMLTMFEDDESVFAAMRAGALGYVLKGAKPDDMIRAIASVAAGEAIFGTGVARRALTYLTRPRSNLQAFPELTGLVEVTGGVALTSAAGLSLTPRSASHRVPVRRAGTRRSPMRGRAGNRHGVRRRSSRDWKPPIFCGYLFCGYLCPIDAGRRWNEAPVGIWLRFWGRRFAGCG